MRKSNGHDTLARDPFFAQPDWAQLYGLSRRRPKTKKQFAQYVELFFDARIPDVVVCRDKGHESPLEIMWRIFLEEWCNDLVVWPRGGGKTFDFSILHVMNGKFKAQCSTTHMGAVDAQSNRCYKHFRNHVTRQPFRMDLWGDPLIGRTVWNNRSDLEILPGTYAQASGPHGQKMFVDEIEQLKWDVWQQANKVPRSAHGIKAQLIAGSTYQVVGSTLHKIVESEALRTHVFCWKEVVQRCTRPLEACQVCKLKPVCADKGMPARQADGFLAIEDLEADITRSDVVSWATQAECDQPGVPEGRVYYAYQELPGGKQEGLNLLIAPPRVWENRPLQIMWDFNVNPFCLEIGQVQPSGDVHVIDEVAMRNVGTEQMAGEVVRRYGAHQGGFIIDGDATGGSRSTKSAHPGETDYTIMRAVFRNLRDVRYKVPEANPPERDQYNSVNTLLCNLAGERRLKIHLQCKFLRADLLYLKYNEGTGVVDTSDSDRTHAAKALGYWIVREFPALGSAQLPMGRAGIVSGFAAGGQLDSIRGAYGRH